GTPRDTAIHMTRTLTFALIVGEHTQSALCHKTEYVCALDLSRSSRYAASGESHSSCRAPAERWRSGERKEHGPVAAEALQTPLFNPAATMQVVQFDDRHFCFVVDDALLNPDELVQFAAERRAEFNSVDRSEERRVGKEGRARRWPEE